VLAEVSAPARHLGATLEPGLFALLGYQRSRVGAPGAPKPASQLARRDRCAFLAEWRFTRLRPSGVRDTVRVTVAFSAFSAFVAEVTDTEEKR
jgi:hypothetical protein